MNGSRIGRESYTTSSPRKLAGREENVDGIKRIRMKTLSTNPVSRRDQDDNEDWTVCRPSISSTMPIETGTSANHFHPWIWDDLTGPRLGRGASLQGTNRVRLTEVIVRLL